MATLVDIEQLKRNIREIESSSVYEETKLGGGGVKGLQEDSETCKHP